MRKEDHVEASLKGTHVLRLSMLQCTGQRRQQRRILGQPISRLPRGKDHEDGLRALVGQKGAPGIRSGTEDTTGVRRRDTREARHDARFRPKVGDGGARRSWALIMIEDT